MPSDPVSPEKLFKCQKCGECCQGYGGTYVSARDIERIAAYLKVDPRRFIENYCQLSGDRPVLAQGPNGYCRFWDGLCTIHAVKPRMCRQWPFIQSVLIDIGNWQIMGGACPGIRTDLPDEVIRTCIEKELRAAERRGKASEE